MIPSNDREAVSLIIDGLTKRGVTLDRVYDGEEDVPTPTKDEALSAIFSVDQAHLHVNLPDGDTGWIFFVLGNEPIEVVCDCTVNVSPFIDPTVNPWWNFPTT